MKKDRGSPCDTLNGLDQKGFQGGLMSFRDIVGDELHGEEKSQEPVLQTKQTCSYLEQHTNFLIFLQLTQSKGGSWVILAVGSVCLQKDVLKAKGSST